MTVLSFPDTREPNVDPPIAVLLPPVEQFIKDCYPTATELDPLERALKARSPIPTLNMAEVM